MQEESKKAEEQTSGGGDSTAENKVENQEEKTKVEDTSQKTDDGSKNSDEQPTKEEIEKWRKKAEDFDKAVRLQRIAKLQKKEGDSSQNKEGENSVGLSEEKIQEIIDKKLEEKMRENNQAVYNQNLEEAYRDFIKENPWADSDDIVAAISNDFNAGGKISKEELLTELRITAQRKFPIQYQKAQEDRIKSQIMIEDANINAGDSGGVSVKKEGEKKGPTKEQIEFAKRCGNDPEKVYSN